MTSSGNRLSRLWKAYEAAFMVENFRRARRILEILWRNDPDHRRVHDHLDVAELRPPGPPWKWISMSNAKLDQLYAHGDDDPAELVDLDETEEEDLIEWDLAPYSIEVMPHEDFSDAVEERFVRRDQRVLSHLRIG